MSEIKFNRRAGHIHQLSGQDFITPEPSGLTNGEFIFYSIVLFVGILTLGVIWN